MKKYRKFLFLIAILSFFFSGCQTRRAPTPVRLVTQVDVRYRHGQETLLRQYTAPEKMSCVLNYIRLLKGGGSPESDPEQTQGDVCKITLHLSDGSRRVYHQRAERYLSRDLTPWEKIDPELGKRLLPILESLESDIAQAFARL